MLEKSVGKETCREVLEKIVEAKCCRGVLETSVAEESWEVLEKKVVERSVVKRQEMLRGVVEKCWREVL